MLACLRDGVGPRRRLRRAAPLDDVGITLIEITATMAIMSIVMTLFSAGVAQMYTSANQNESRSIVQTQLHTAFLRLDRDIRYASGVSKPGQAGGNWYVEYVIANTAVTDCTQLRLVDSTGLLQRRSRRDSGAISSWTTLASYLTGRQPFARTEATSSGAAHQVLGVTLTLRAGAGTTGSNTRMGFTFAALNTSAATRSDGVCSDLVRT